MLENTRQIPVRPSTIRLLLAALLILVLGLYLQLQVFSQLQTFAQQHPLVDTVRSALRSIDSNTFNYEQFEYYEVLITEQDLFKQARFMIIHELLAVIGFVTWYYWLRPRFRYSYLPLLLILFITTSNQLTSALGKISDAYYTAAFRLDHIQAFMPAQHLNHIQQAHQAQLIGFGLLMFALLLASYALNRQAIHNSISQWFKSRPKYTTWLLTTSILTILWLQSTS